MQQLIASQTSPEVPINENFATLAYAAVYGQAQATTSGLTWGYYGGRWGGVAVTDGTLTLADNATNYVVVLLSSGVISVSSTATAWNNTGSYSHVFKLTTSGGAVTATEDHRAGPNGIFGALGGGGGSGSVELRGFGFTSDTSSTTDADPGNGKFRWNTTTQSSATVLYLDAQTADGASMVTLFGAIGGNGFLYLQESDDATKWQKWKWTAVTAGSSNAYFKFAVTLEASSAGAISSGVLVYFDLDVVAGSAASGTVTSVGITGPSNGAIIVNNSPITGAGSIALGVSDRLASLQGLSASGPVRVASNGSLFSGPGAVTLGTDTAGSLPVAQGGTGLTAGTSGGLLFFSASGVLVATPAFAGNRLMIGGGSTAAPTTVASLGTVATVLHGNASGAPSWGPIDMTVDVSGLLPVTSGGTGASTAAGARTALGLGTASMVDIDTDPAFAANSDTRVSSQRAVVSYVQSKLDGRSWKQTVRLASIANGDLATAFAAGQSMDGQTIVAGDRLLLKDQTAALENGLYVANASGAPTRSSDADNGSELVNATVEVSEGSVNAEKQFTCSTDAPITVGATGLVFVPTSTSGTGYTADEIGLHLAGTVFSLKPGGVDLTTDVSGVLPVANLATGTPNGTQFVRDDGTLAVPPSAPLAAPSNAQIGVSYSISSDDRAKHVTFDNAAAVAVDIAQAGTAGLEDGFFVYLQNIGVGSATVTPTTSTVNGQTALLLVTGQGAVLFCDGVNYTAIVTGGGASDFVSGIHNIYPNDSIPVYSLSPDTGAPDVDVALTTPGGGALLRFVPDGGNVNGDKRGYGATDLQSTISDFRQVASGSASTIVGGVNNTSSAQYSGILSGFFGHTRQTFGAQSHGTKSMSSGSGVWRAQHRRVVLTSNCTDATPVIMTADGNIGIYSSTNQICLEEDLNAFAFSALVHAASSTAGTADCGVWRISGAVRRIAGVASLMGNPVVDTIVAPAGVISVAPSVDSANGLLQFTSTGLAAEQTYFCAVVDLNELDMPP